MSKCKFVKMAGAFNPDSMDEFMHAAEASYRRFETNFDNICAKYGRPFPDSDIICLKTGEILTDNGTVKKLKPVQFGGAKLAVTKRRADKLMTTLSQSNLDITGQAGRPADAMSMYSNYVGGSINHSHIADDVTKILSFIVEENEPSDAETISSGDSSNALEENSQDTSDDDSFLDELDGDFDYPQNRTRETGVKPRKLQDGKVWYSLGTSSDNSGHESDASCRKVYGSVNSHSKDEFSRIEDSESTDLDQRVNVNPLSVWNVETFRLSKQHTEDSGFESGPGKHAVSDNGERKHTRMFCLNDDKINRVMTWVKEQAKEHPNIPVPDPEREQHDISLSDDVLRSPTKIRKTLHRDNKDPLQVESEQSVLQSPALKAADGINKTYTVPFENNTNNLGGKTYSTTGKENKTFVIDASNIASSKQTNLLKLNESTVLLDNSDVASCGDRNESGCLTPRRIVRARKRAFTPVHPSYTSEQLLDYLTSPVPKTIIKMLSPSCPRMRQTAEQVVTVPTPPPTPEMVLDESRNDYFNLPKPSVYLQNAHPPCQDKNSKIPDIADHEINKVSTMQHNCLNDLNKDVTRESNTSIEDVMITKVKIEPVLVATEQETPSSSHSPVLHDDRSMYHSRMLSAGDDAVTVCRGFKERDHEDVMITKVKLEPGLADADLDTSVPTQLVHPVGQEVNSRRHPRRLSTDDAITLCEGFGREFPEHDHVLSPVNQMIKPSLYTNIRRAGQDAAEIQCRSTGSRNKKQIFDRLKKAGCSSDSKVLTEKAHSRNSVRARRQLAMDQERNVQPEGERSESHIIVGSQRKPRQQERNGECMLSRDPVCPREKNYLSFEEHRETFFRHKQRSTRAPHEDMDTDDSETYFHQDGTCKKLVDRKLPSEHRRSNQKVKKISNKASGSSLPGDTLASGGNARNRRDRHAYRDSGDDSITANPSSSVILEPQADTATGSSQVNTSASQQTQSDVVMSPVNGRKSNSSVPGLGLSPVTALSHLQLNSPTHVKPTKPALHRKSNNELFIVSRDPSSLQSQILSRSGNQNLSGKGQSPKKRDVKSMVVNQSPRKRDILSRDVGPYPVLIDDGIPSSRKKNLLSDLAPSPRKSKTEKSDRSCLFQETRDANTKSAFKDVRSSSSANLTRSSKHAQKSLDCPRKPLNDECSNISKCSKDIQKSSASYESRIISKDSTKDSLNTKKAGSLEKPVFLVPDQSSVMRLKPVRSTKKKQSQFHTNSLDRKKGLFSKSTSTSYHLGGIQSSCWTSTPAKSRSVPILNDTISTIHLGAEDRHSSSGDDEEEVRTISPYSFMSEGSVENS